MKRRAIANDVVIRHQRNSSLSSLGSGDWGSDVGASVEDCSTGESASDQSDRVRIVAEMAILASTSPEIVALSQRKGEGFHRRPHGGSLPSPSSSIGSSIGSKSSLSVASLISEESKSGDTKGTTGPMHSPAGQLADNLAALTFENLRIEAPPTTKREQVSDIASLIDMESKENKRQYLQTTTPKEAESSSGCRCQLRRYLHAMRQDHCESFGSCGSIGNSNIPLKPLKTVAVTTRPPSPRPSMHRRVSFDSLPTPLEIGSSVPLFLCNSIASDRITYSTPTPEKCGLLVGSKLEHSQGASERQGSILLLSRSRPDGRSFFCTPTSELANPHVTAMSEHSQKQNDERQNTSSL